MEKLIEKFKKVPKTLNYDDLKTILNHFGYIEDTGGKTSGSSIKFINDKKKIIMFHTPHPQKEVKSYVIKLVLKHLKENGDLSE